MKKRNWKKFEGKLVKVEWFDACTREEVVLKNMTNFSSGGEELLTKNTTYGLLYKVFKNVIVIVTETTIFNNKAECTIIPEGWVTNISKNDEKDRIRKVA